MKSLNVRYLPGVDHLRALAATLIVLYHGLQLYSHWLSKGTGGFDVSEWIHTRNPILALIVEGHTSVGLFMVLSGFIFTNGAHGKGVKFWPFMTNRVLRIFPLMIFMLVCAIAAFPGAYKFVGVLQVLFLQSNNEGAFSVPTYTGMFWAIGVEFQFYLLFPFLCRFTHERGAIYLLGVLATLAVFRGAASLGENNARDLAYFTILGRMDQFVVGMLGALAHRRITQVGFKNAKLALLPATVAVVGVVWCFHRAGGWPSLASWKLMWPTVEALTWITFVLTYLEACSSIPNLLSRVLSKLGEISFSTYLVHYLVISLLIQNGFVVKFANQPVTAAILNTLLVAWPITLLVSALTYQVIEKPFLNLRRPYLDPIAGC